eukprot:23438-Amphidinium_carterae.1
MQGQVPKICVRIALFKTASWDTLHGKVFLDVRISNPLERPDMAAVRSLLRRLSCKHKLMGSNPG